MLPCHVKRKAVAAPTDFRKQTSPSLHAHSLNRDDRLRMPKLDKMSPEEQVSISKKMFYGGLAFLPLLWLVNFVYFFRTIRQPSAPREMRKCMYGMGTLIVISKVYLHQHYGIDVYMSLGGCLVWFIILTTWYALFVERRTQWGAGADRITVVIPKGS